MIPAPAPAGVARREDLGLQFLQVGLKFLGDLDVVVDDRVADRVHDRGGARHQHIGLRLEPSADRRERGALAVPDRHHEGVTYEDHHLTGCDRVTLGLVLDGLEHQEQRIVIHLELGTLMRGEGVLHGQRVQRKLTAHMGELLLGRFVETDPEEGVPFGARLGESIGEVRGPVRTVSVAVNGAVDDHGAYSPRSVPSTHARPRRRWRPAWSGPAGTGRPFPDRRRIGRCAVARCRGASGFGLLV